MAVSKNGTFFGDSHLGSGTEMLAIHLRPWATVIQLQYLASMCQNVRRRHS
jgi:hypothetical protein